MVAITKRDLRRFGLHLGAVLLALALYETWHGGWGRKPLVISAAGGILVGLGAIAPRLLVPVFSVWGRLAGVLGWLNTRIVLAVVFFLVLTPLALLARLMGHDPLARKRPSRRDSYWQKRTTESDIARYKRQF